MEKKIKTCVLYLNENEKGVKKKTLCLAKSEV